MTGVSWGRRASDGAGRPLAGSGAYRGRGLGAARVLIGKRGEGVLWGGAWSLEFPIRSQLFGNSYIHLLCLKEARDD